MSRKTWLLVTSEVLGLFVNTLTADDKYYCFKRENFQQEFQMHLSQKAKNLVSIFIPFLESTSNFQHFGKKCETHSSNFSEILTPKDFDTSMPERFRFRTTFSSRHINESQILLKSDRQHFCPNGLFLGKFTTEFEFFLFMARILASGSQWVKKQSYDFRCYQERCFPTQYLPKWQIIWIKVLSGRFQQCLVPLNLLTGKWCPKTGPFRYSKSQLFLSQ